MKKSNLIRRSIAFVLLLVFTIGITPKPFFHFLFADHKDDISCNDPIGTPIHVHKQPVNCHFDNIVVTAPYVSDNLIPLFSIPVFHKIELSTYFLSHSQPAYCYKETRGPPAA